MKHLILCVLFGMNLCASAVIPPIDLEPRSNTAASSVMRDVAVISAKYRELVKKHKITGVSLVSKNSYVTKAISEDAYRWLYVQEIYGEHVPCALGTPLGTVVFLESCAGYDADKWKAFKDDLMLQLKGKNFASDVRPVAFKGNTQDSAVQLEFFKKYDPQDPDYKKLIDKFKQDVGQQ